MDSRVRSGVAVVKNPLLDAALDYITEGFKVLPLCWPTPGGKCGCGHKPEEHTGNDIGKAPYANAQLRHGLKDATRTTGEIEKYWERCPEANIGLRTDSLLVLDLDPRNGSLASMNELEREFDPLPQTRKHETGGGGIHYIYRLPENCNVKCGTLRPGIDIKSGIGGYIVVPPSLHKSGKRYIVLDNSPIAIAPDWLIKLCKNSTTVLKSKKRQKPQKNGEAIPQGSRTTTLCSYAGTMRRAGMTESEILASLNAVNTRCEPQLTEEELKKIAGSIADYLPMPESFRAPNDVFNWELSEHEMIVYIYLCRCCHNNQKAHPSYTNISKCCGIGRSTAVTAALSLERKGKIEITRSYKDTGEPEANIYRILGYGGNGG